MARARWRHKLRIPSILTIVLVLGMVPPSVAAAQDPIQVRVHSQAVLMSGSIEVSVSVRCHPFGEHFESNITVTQDEQSIFAHRGLPIIACDGRWHVYTVLATPFDGSFHPGAANVSAFVSRLDPVTSDIRQGQDSATVRVR